MALPIADWQVSLDAMQTALETTLAALDRYQSGWAGLLADQASGSGSPSAVDFDFQLREWDARLLAASELAASVERELHDREQTVGRWRESLKERRRRSVQGERPEIE